MKKEVILLIVANHNIYHDRYDQESGLIYYTGKGQVGEQTLGGVNGRIANAKQNGDDNSFIQTISSWSSTSVYG